MSPEPRAVRDAEARNTVRRLGIEAGRIEIGDDLDAPMPDELLAAFEGRTVGGDDPPLAADPTREGPFGPETEGITPRGS